MRHNHPNTYETIICDCCGKSSLKLKRRSVRYCSVSCASKERWNNKKYRKIITDANVNRCKSSVERKRLRDIGRKGGFGEKGYTKSGIYFQSSLERKIFEWLDEIGIKYTPHKPIPNSSKVSDIYFENKNLWIEIDGINREKKQKWLKKEYKYWQDKLNIYKRENLQHKIVYSLKDLQQIFK